MLLLLLVYCSDCGDKCECRQSVLAGGGVRRLRRAAGALVLAPAERQVRAVLVQRLSW